jgi:PAS domain S-box-containing protein
MTNKKSRSGHANARSTKRRLRRGAGGQANQALRRMAEKKLKTRPKDTAEPLLGDAARIIHELRVHQIELEMQNEELHRAQGDLEASRSQYFDLYDLAPVGYFTLSNKGLILEANLTAARLFGVARKQLVKQPVARFIFREDQGIYDRHRKQLMETGRPQVCELRMLCADAAPFWARLEAIAALGADGAPMFRAVVSDITNRKQLEDAQLFLAQSGYQHSGEDFFQALARYLALSLNMDYVCIDRLLGDGLVAQTVAIYSAGKFEDNVEYALKDTPCGDVVGKTICCFQKDVRHLFPRDAALQELMAESYVGTTLWSFDGKPIGLIAIIGRKPLVNPYLAESVLKLVAVRAAGELERRRAEEELRRTALELARSNQELEQFAHVASHDLKEPLRMVTGFLNLLKNQYQGKLDAKAGEYIAFALDAAERMQTLMNDLLTYARVGRIKVVESTNVSDAVDEVLKNLQASIDESGAVITRDSLPTIPVNPGELTQVFQNLIGNAIKFRRKGVTPKVHIGVEKMSGDGGQETGVTQQQQPVAANPPLSDTRNLLAHRSFGEGGNHGAWLFSVRDNGIGIDPRCHDRLFTIFQRLHTREEYPGSGVGLAICKKIVERHDGRIWVESELGKGSAFCFSIPDKE